VQATAAPEPATNVMVAATDRMIFFIGVLRKYVERQALDTGQSRRRNRNDSLWLSIEGLVFWGELVCCAGSHPTQPLISCSLERHLDIDRDTRSDTPATAAVIYKGRGRRGDRSDQRQRHQSAKGEFLHSSLLSFKCTGWRAAIQCCPMTWHEIIISTISETYVQDKHPGVTFNPNPFLWGQSVTKFSMSFQKGS
jgi:hypothetical protein